MVQKCNIQQRLKNYFFVMGDRFAAGAPRVLMDFKEVLFFVTDTTACVAEEDDPANSIILFHPSELSTEAKCSWASQILGLACFWKTSFKSDCKFLRIAGYHFSLREIRSRFLVVLGWLSPDTTAPQDLVKLDLAEKLQFLVGKVELFLGAAFEELAGAAVPASVSEDLVRTIFSLYPLTWGDFRVKSNHISLFRDVDFIKTICNSILHKCRSNGNNAAHMSLPLPAILCGFITFRADVLLDEIPDNLQAYRRAFLIACFRDDALEKLPSFDDGLSQHAFHRLFLPVDDYESFRLARNLREASETIRSLGASPVRRSSIKSLKPAGRTHHHHHSTTTSSDETVPVLIYVLQSRGTSLALLVDMNQPDESFRRYVQNLSVTISPLLNVVEESAINHILRSQSSSTRRNSSPRLEKFVFDKAADMFSRTSDSEEVCALLLESQLSMKKDSLVSCNIRQGHLSCLGEDFETFQTFTVTYGCHSTVLCSFEVIYCALCGRTSRTAVAPRPKFDKSCSMQGWMETGRAGLPLDGGWTSWSEEMTGVPAVCTSRKGKMKFLDFRLSRKVFLLVVWNGSWPTNDTVR
ncbi:hypothetical protein BV898_07657 [Hypsibius exemplaris]|uniref:CCZ1/INTU/HSP4 first Longin domain-containing protein n=1 Tax=Hypsibius exemplaris TaxID=2072580 RepID=A0A1W0WST7_HYPEX|nr:hypothetical protein BV898_07657 [Hypsibius exemplaris]